MTFKFGDTKGCHDKIKYTFDGLEELPVLTQKNDSILY